MGIITRSFTFMMGTACGVYIAQNYDVPDIKKLFVTNFEKLKRTEEIHRKPNKEKDDL
ncbi:hypothetical protein DCAR_0728448 [Daucus carota subsp. sativus]|uniref:Uncharacterized protein n=1 Tax=Daucus carota subsp. sativus TaxID=79200 RepID=A0A161X5I5_DAUCS|nr:PREDICTED: uncharacterized protein LOC108193985 [Daucus carota subsp. sativus]WOH08997.1 hypothetical protein DCAR_0728448 [Daucus carota subsp. sativus]